MYINKRLIPPSPDQWASDLGIASATRILSRLNLFRFAYNTKRSSFWTQMRTRIKRGQLVLDAGCGLGQLVWFLNDQGYKAWGLDYSEKMIGFLEKRFPDLRWFVGLIQDMPFEECSFDHIISGGVIEHDPDGPDKALAEFHRVIRKDGFIFVTVPFDSPHQRRSQEIQFPSNFEGTSFFQFFWTSDDLKTKIEANGFQVMEILPISKSYAVLFPEEYIRICQQPKFPNNLRARILNIRASLTKDSYSNLLAVAKKV